jgi:hypothetical protein
MARVIAPGAAALLARLVDYAGLFPPADLDMRAAVAEYARARRSSEAWMLGRFVVPASRLAELSDAAESFPTASDPWLLSVLFDADLAADAAALVGFNERTTEAIADTVEVKAASPADVDRALSAVPAGVTTYVELGMPSDLAAPLHALAERGARAKVRTGGVTPQAIPSPSDVARFLVACARAGVAFKATAGLHHPVRSLRPLTYAADSPKATMHGFLNVFAAAALARVGVGLADVEEVIREEDAATFRFDDQGLSVGARRVSTENLAEVRRTFAFGFGSCSFAEPVSDLESLGFL